MNNHTLSLRSPSSRVHLKEMGSLEDYSYRKTSSSTSQQSGGGSTAKNWIKIFLLVISTNLITFFFISGGGGGVVTLPNYAARIGVWSESGVLLKELNATKEKLSESKEELSEVRRRLATAEGLMEALLSELGKKHGERAESSPEEIDGWREELFGELKLAVGPHKLPLGFTANLGSDEIYPSLGSACRRYQEDLIHYMTYDVGGECPSDDNFAQRLMLKGCEPLPRRRCHPKSPANFTQPTPYPASLWSTPADTSIAWDPYTCKNYTCLVNRKHSRGSYDCKDCFDLDGREKTRWTHDNAELDFSIDWVLSKRPRGTIRIGLDIGGGSGTFAARMSQRHVTIVTTTMNFDGPFNNFIASRGLVPLHVSIANRLPFYDATLDIIHSMHVLSNWVPDAMLEFALYDVYRVLRPGGIFWLDHFFCFGRQMNATYVPMFDRIGFRRLRWNAGRKLDRGIDKDEWYLSALFEKPLT